MPTAATIKIQIEPSIGTRSPTGGAGPSTLGGGGAAPDPCARIIKKFKKIVSSIIRGLSAKIESSNSLYE